MAEGFDINKLSLGEKIMAGAGIVLVIDLLVFPWHSVDVFGETFTRSGIESPNSFYGLLAFLIAAAVVVLIVIRNFTNVQLPSDVGGQSWSMLFFIAGIVIAALLLLKLVVETEFLGFGAYLGIILGAAMAYGGYLVRQEGPAAAAGGGSTASPPPPPPPPPSA
jgi:hypothetical protein